MVEKKQTEKKVEKVSKIDNKNEEKINELKIEFLKQTAKRKDIKRQIAKIMTIENKLKEEKKKK